MANQKITDLAALTSAVGTDVIEIVSDPGGSPASKKITVDNLIGKSGAMAVQTNPKAMAQGVHMTYAASGSSGIYTGDDDDIDFGTGNFTLVWKGSLPDWTPSNYVNLIARGSASPVLYLQLENSSTGKIRVNRGGTVALSTVGNTITDGTVAEITAVFSGDTVTFYINGKQLGDIVACTATDVTSASNLQILGDGPLREAGTVQHVYTYNRALTASEVLDLYRNGIAFADKWGSQTEAITNGSFTGNANGWTLDAGWAYNSNNVTVTDKDTGYMAYQPHSATIKVGDKWRVIYTISGYDHGGAKIRLGGDYVGTVRQANGTYTEEVTCISEGTIIGIVTSGLTTLTIDDVSFIKIGATLALEPEGIQPAPGQWLDSSTNKLHAMQPASGSSLIRKKDTFEVRWTNTWAGTHEAQYIGGVNQAVLPANCYIESIIGVISGSTIEDIIIGDGSDTDRWVAATTGLAAGTTSFTLANRISDGTNYKLVVDPDANFTGSIAWTIKGIILQ